MKRMIAFALAVMLAFGMTACGDNTSSGTQSASSASLTLNENCDPTVRHDMERFFLRTVPDNGNYEHDYEGADDMPSHIKSSMLGTSLVLPVHKGRIQTGTWQGIWLGEHRIHGGSRRIIATLQGE